MLSGNWDYIIVGAGSAGCVLAERLSADGKSQVLLLEAGGTNTHPFIKLPKGMGKLVMRPKYAWHFPVAQPRKPDMPASEVWVRGRGLGGSSAVNGMIWMRGQAEDYQDWERMGAAGWGWDTMRAAFRAIEDHELGDDGLRGVGGPVHISAGHYRYPLSEALIEAGMQTGLERRDDLNREDNEGVGYYPHNILNGRRQSAAETFLKPARKRANLTVKTGVLVDKVLFSDDLRATGVAARAHGAPVTFHTNGEVILAAGTLLSPKILQHSGIGSGALLSSVGVNTLVESPDVGERMREHLGFSIPYRLKNTAGNNKEFHGFGLFRNVLRYYLRRDGPLATGPFEVGAFIKTSPAVARPDAQLYAAAFTFARGDDDNFPIQLNDVEHAPGLTIYGQLLRLTSEGHVRISSANPDSLPTITPNWLTTAEDEQVAVAMIHKMRAYMAQPAITPWLEKELFPGEARTSDTDLLDAFRRFSLCGTHAVATCRMGSDNRSVVDPDLKVRGVSGLRVCDASIMPAPVSGNTNAPVMALAWAAAARIKS
jgi:choline dehydrogenase